MSASLLKRGEWRAGQSARPEPEATAPLAVAATGHSAAPGPAHLDTALLFAPEREQAREEGYRQGFAEGKEAGFQAGLKAAQASVEQWMAEQSQQQHQQLAQVVQLLEQWLASQQSALDELVLVAVRRLLGEAWVTPEGVQAAVRQTVGQLHMAEPCTIELHPDDLKSLGDAFRQSLPDVRWVANAQLELGGLLFRDQRGQFDATLPTQLALLRRQLRHGVADAGGDER